MLWFTVKVLILLFVFVWLRGTMPRLRYDQFMRFGWKVLVPTALAWILVVATMRTLSRHANLATGEAVVYVGIPLAIVLIAGLLVASRAGNRATRLAAREAAAGSIHPTEPEEPQILPPVGPRRRPAQRTGPSRAEGGFPIPPMDLVVPPSPRLRGEAAVSDGAPGTAVVGTGRRGSTVMEQDAPSATKEDGSDD
jgi:NADH-quinone oxidoreductase subunit H